jgi:protein-tyrosine-phosphatase
MLETLQTDEYDMVLPVTEASMAAVSALRPQLPAEVTLLMPGDEHLRYCLSKYHSSRAAMEAGLPVPPTVFVHDGSPDCPWNDDLSGLEFPVILKVDNFLTDDGVYLKGRGIVAGTKELAQDILDECRDQGFSVIAQQLVPGSGAGAFILRWGDKITLTFSHRRLHEVPWTGGASSFRESCHEPELQQHAAALLDSIGYQGVAMVEFRRDGEGGTPYFMEINGRFWGSLALALHAGVDFPAALVDCYLEGHPSAKRTSTDYPDGIRCRNLFPGEFHHLLSIIKSSPVPGHPQPPSKLKSLARYFLLTFDPRIRHDYSWWSDPLPGFFQGLAMAREIAGRIRNKLKSMSRQRKQQRELNGAVKQHNERLESKSPYFEKPPRKILFLCFGNICRSPFAELYWNRHIEATEKKGDRPQCPALSAGFIRESGRTTPQRLQPIIESFGVDISSHRSRVVSAEMIDEADAIFVMDRENHYHLLRKFPRAHSKTLFLGQFDTEEPLEIPDPYLLDTFQAHAVYRKLVRSLDALAEQMK